MSYAMYNLVNQSATALLDPIILESTAQKVFATFFKNFALKTSVDIPAGYAFQYYHEPNLDLNYSQAVTYPFNNERRNKKRDSGDNVVPASIAFPADQLVMSKLAVYLSLSILMFLIITTVFVHTTRFNLYKQLPRDVNTVGSIIGFVYDSDRLRGQVEIRERKDSIRAKQRPWFSFAMAWLSALRISYGKLPLAKNRDSRGDKMSKGEEGSYAELDDRKYIMGYFRSGDDETGKVRWGIEESSVETVVPPDVMPQNELNTEI